jgi:hypothetical protein
VQKRSYRCVLELSALGIEVLEVSAPTPPVLGLIVVSVPTPVEGLLVLVVS